MAAVLAALAALFALVAQASTMSDELWNEYHFEVSKNLLDKFKDYTKGLEAFGCNTDIARTRLHVLTDPAEALWGDDPKELSAFAGFVPDWSPQWSVRYSRDNSLIERYKALIESCRDKNTPEGAISKLMDSKSAFMVQSPHHPTLSQLASSSKMTPFRIVVQGKKRSSAKNILFDMPSIVRSLENDGDEPVWKDLLVDDESALDEIYSDMDEILEDDDADFLSMSELFGRRRRRSRKAPRPVMSPIYIKSRPFYMDMSAQGLAGIVVGTPGIDRKFIRSNRSRFSGNWFGKDGQFALLPSIIWVVKRPEVVLRLSESEFKKLQKHWNEEKSLGVAVAGIFFRNANFKHTAGESLSDIFSEEELEDLLMDDGLMDSATFVVKSVDASGDETILQEGPLDSASVMNGPDTATFRISEDDILSSDDDEGMQDDEAETLAFSKLFGRRRRRRRSSPPPPPPPVIHERVYEVRFVSKSTRPHVLAVTSDIL